MTARDAAWPAAMALALIAATPPDRGGPGLHAPGRQPLLARYYEQYLADGDPDAFRARVEARYSEATLRRLVHADDDRARRGAVEALGLFGTFDSNAALASALADDDPAVRALASRSLWAVWFRADEPENNQTLQEVSTLIAIGRLEAADRLATELIARAPDFAEAYNQRAIALFGLSRYAESAADCRRVLERNPYHFGALDGLAACCLELGQNGPALEACRRSLKLQPHNAALRARVAALETAAK